MSPYNTCNNRGVDECLTWGDYYYVEALLRYIRKGSRTGKDHEKP